MAYQRRRWDSAARPARQSAGAALPAGVGEGADDRAPVIQWYAAAVSSGELQAGAPQRVGRYSLLRRLGRGGMSSVFRAYDPELDRQVALKLVSHFDAGPSAGPARLVREARAMARISHPNVAAVYDVGMVGDAVYIAMELIEGLTLSNWLKASPRPWTEILRMYLLAGRGLAAAHEVGLIHRDFKPDNVMVGPEGRPRVLDFGLARPASSDDDVLLLPNDELTREPAAVPPSSAVLATGEAEGATSLDELAPPLGADELTPRPPEEDAVLISGSRSPSGPISGSFDLRLEVTQHGAITGTPAYMAPEQHEGERGGPASDQFAFCVALWEALYRERPYQGRTLFEIADAMVEGRLQPPPSHTPVPAWLHRSLERGLETDPRSRHPSLRSLIATIVFTFKVMHGLT